MNFRAELKSFLGSDDVVVIVKCPDDAGRVAGKYLVGRHQAHGNIVAFVFDAAASFHPVIAKRYRLNPLGGAHFTLDPADASLWIGGTSDTYGADPDPALTIRVLTAALPDYTVTAKAKRK